MVLAVLGVLGVLAMDPLLLMRTHTDPSRMRYAQRRTAQHHATAWLAGGETAFTHIAWLRRRETKHLGAKYGTMLFQSFFSVAPARATREGGDKLPAIREVSTAFSGSGGTFANPNYDTHGIAGWEYGCYAVNIETDTPLTLVLAGTEKQVAGSNGVMQAFNIQGSAADWSWSIAGGNGIRFGFGVNPLVEFFGTGTNPLSMRDMLSAETRAGGVDADLTNEWTMVVSRARIEGGNLRYAIDALRWDGEAWHEDEATKPAPAAAFARGARTAFCTFSVLGGGATDGTPYLWDEYGAKLFAGRWLTDDEVRTVRDLDMFEMRRRGMTRWASEVEVE